VGTVANPKYGTTVADDVIEISTDTKVRRYWVEAFDSPGPVFFTIDGSEPGIGQDGSYALPTGGGSLEFSRSTAAVVTVKVTSAHVCLVSVRTL
jgi:hypothetical protein